MNLQMVGAGVLRRGDEGNRFRVQRIAHIDDRISVAEHVTDESVPLVQDNLYAVGSAALIIARQEANVGCGGACGQIHHKARKFRGPADSRQPGLMR